jgi:hypothetical protein
MTLKINNLLSFRLPIKLSFLMEQGRKNWKHKENENILKPFFVNPNPLPRQTK